jgi:hypothetical protein
MKPVSCPWRNSTMSSLLPEKKEWEKASFLGDGHKVKNYSKAVYIANGVSQSSARDRR